MELRTARRCLPHHTPVPSLCNKLDTVVSVMSFGLQDYCPTATFLCHLVHISFFTQGLALFGHFSFRNLLVKTVSLMFTLAKIYVAATCSLLSSHPILQQVASYQVLKLLSLKNINKTLINQLPLFVSVVVIFWLSW